MVKNSKSLSFWHWLRSHKFYSALMLVLLVVAGVLIYQKVALEINKRDFQQARVAIDNVYADIVTKVGQPDNYKRVNDCSRPSQEFGQGPLSCSVGTDFIYGVADEQAANAQFREIQSVIAQHTEFRPTQPLATSIKDTLVVNTYYHSAQDYYKSHGLDCTIKYSYDTPRETYLTLKAQSNMQILFMSFGCDGFARFQYYPIE